MDFPIMFMNWMIDSNFINEGQKIILEDMWNDLISASTIDKGISTVYWMRQFEDNNKFNFIIKRLSLNNIIESTVDFGYAQLKLRVNVDNETKNNSIFDAKMHHYMLDNNPSKVANITKTKSDGYKDTGLVRNGFAKASYNRFKLDTKYIAKYAEYIANNIYQDINSTIKDVKYSEIVAMLVDYYTIPDIYYSIGKAISDSRGRNIPRCTKKIGNPISSKDIRACLILPKPMQIDSNDIKTIYAFIAELNGYKGKNYKDKYLVGESMYLFNEKPSLDEMIENKDFSDLHARIWLERIYEALDNIDTNNYMWDIPIECDATASMLQITSVLLNDHTYMDYTNLINPEEFKDAWTIEGLPRDYVKKAVTPRLYGSSAEPAQLWEKHKFNYSQEQVNIITKEIRTGRYARANKFKDFIINNVNPKPSMKVKIWNEEFTVECNRFKEDDTEKVAYSIYTSSQGLYRTAYISEERKPDLKAFKRYFQTLLIHNLDSQVANSICESNDISWIIPNHDAFLVHPSEVNKVRKLYTSKLMDIYKDRHSILINYFKSIGINKNIVFEDKDDVEEFSGFCLK